MELQLDALEQQFDSFLADQRAKLEKERNGRIDSRLFMILVLLLCLCYLVMSRLPARTEDEADA